MLFYIAHCDRNYWPIKSKGDIFIIGNIQRIDHVLLDADIVSITTCIEVHIPYFWQEWM